MTKNKILNPYVEPDHFKNIWNAAIEAAAKEAEQQEYGHEAAYEIRKLKK